ncbi:MAG: LysE family transporter [Bacillota bacterium]
MQWVWYGALIGIIWSCPLDSIDLEAARVGAGKGFWPALAVECGAITADSIIFTLLITELGQWVHLASQSYLPLINFFVLIFIGYYYLDKSRNRRITAPSTGRLVIFIENPYINGLIRAVISPPVALFIPSFLGAFVTSASANTVIPMTAGFVIGCLAWAVPFSLIVAGLGALMGLQRYILMVNRVVGLTCFGLAFVSLWKFIDLLN